MKIKQPTELERVDQAMHRISCWGRHCKVLAEKYRGIESSDKLRKFYTASHWVNHLENARETYSRLKRRKDFLTNKEGHDNGSNGNDTR